MTRSSVRVSQARLCRVNISIEVARPYLSVPFAYLNIERLALTLRENWTFV